MKYLVLGSAGQIGAPLVNFLKQKGHEVETFDIIDSTNEDLRVKDNILLKEKINNCDFVFFLAFDVGGARYLAKYQHTFDFINNNVQIMENVFSELKRTNKKFIFASSQMSEMNFSPYGVCKSIGEKYTLSLDGVIVRFWNVYGPEKDLEKSHVITDFINKAKNDGVINMLTDGSERRQFLHVDDCCDCLYIMSKEYNKLDKFKEYHVTSYNWSTIIEVANIISKNFHNAPITKAEQKDGVQKNLGTDPNKNVLDFWKPMISLEEGIKKIIEDMS